MNCYCGRYLPIPKNPEKGNVYYCKCGVKWIWKRKKRNRLGRWIYAGKWK